MKINNKIKKAMQNLLLVSLLLPFHWVLADNNIQPGIDFFNAGDYQNAYKYFDAIESDSNNRKYAEFQYYYGLSLKARVIKLG